MSIKHNINFGLTGSVSVGKSTVLNALLWEYLGETKLKRTTYVPFKFVNVNGKKHDTETIKNEIIKINNENCDEIKMKEFEIDFRWNKDSLYNCTIIDFPGLNDPHEVDNKMETVLFNELVNLDYLIYVMDSKISLNNKYERNFIEKLFDNIKNCDTLTTLIILFNKYDEDNEEIDELIDEAKKFINECTIKYEITAPKMYKISGRKIMIKNVILKSQNQEIIPKNIRETVYRYHFGYNKSNKMMKLNFSELEEKINNILFTKDEYDFIYEFYDIFNDKSFYSKKLNDTQTKIDACISKNSNKKFEIYTNLFEKYLNLNIILEDDDKRNFIIKSIEYYINNYQFAEYEEFLKYILFYTNYLTFNIYLNNNDKFDIIVKSIDYYINKYKCTLDNCKIIYSTIYENNMFKEDKKEYYFFEYLKKMIDFYFEEDQLKIINDNVNRHEYGCIIVYCRSCIPEFEKFKSKYYGPVVINCQESYQLGDNYLRQSNVQRLPTIRYMWRNNNNNNNNNNNYDYYDYEGPLTTDGFTDFVCGSAFNKMFYESIFGNIFKYIVDLENDKYNLYFIEKIITKQLFFNHQNNINIIDFLVNNYHLIKLDNKLDIINDIGSNHIIISYIYFNYIYKIYINCVYHIIETSIDKLQLHKQLLEFKCAFGNNPNKTNPMKYEQHYNSKYGNIDCLNSYMHKKLDILTEHIDEKSDIFRNFDKKYARYYPIEIITLYNFYMHN
jgi:hypothetical protein